MTLEESLKRILESDERFADLFYVVYLDRHPGVRRFFAQVDLRHQAILLTVALQIVVQHHSGRFPITNEYLRILGRKHQNWGVDRALYPEFLDALLATLTQFLGSQWSPSLAEEWKAALEGAAGRMLEGYA